MGWVVVQYKDGSLEVISLRDQEVNEAAELLCVCGMGGPEDGTRQSFAYCAVHRDRFQLLQVPRGH